eukprot:Colp12_sorted_trinity150504_noHs@2168
MATTAVLQRTFPPMLKAALTSGSVMALGDILCQTVDQADKAEKTIDLARTTRFGIVGFCLHGPYFYKALQQLDVRFGTARNLSTVVKKSLVGHCVVFPPYLLSFLTVMGALEGKNLPQIKHKIEANAAPIFIAGSFCWPFANMVNFALIPLQHRIVYINFVGVFWNSYLSYRNKHNN